MWFKGEGLLYQSSYRLTDDDRFTLHADHSLNIENLTETDYDTYKCSILPENIDIFTELRPSNGAAQLKASILIDGRDVNERAMTFRQGDRIELLCKSKMPRAANAITYVWSSAGSRLESGEQQTVDGGRLIIESANKNHNGIYQCLADDKTDITEHASVTIKVYCKCEWNISTSVVVSS